MQLLVEFIMCEGHDYCKTKAEIQEWLRGKYIVLLFNQARFQSNKFDDSVVVKESRIKYIPINSQSRWISPFKLTVSELFLQDNLSIELDDVTLDNR